MLFLKLAISPCMHEYRWISYIICLHIRFPSIAVCDCIWVCVCVSERVFVQSVSECITTKAYVLNLFLIRKIVRIFAGWCCHLFVAIVIYNVWVYTISTSTTTTTTITRSVHAYFSVKFHHPLCSQFWHDNVMGGSLNKSQKGFGDIYIEREIG